MTDSATTRLQYPEDLLKKYPDVLEPHALKTLEELASLNAERIALMERRSERRRRRFAEKERITFLDPHSTIAGTTIK